MDFRLFDAIGENEMKPYIIVTIRTPDKRNYDCEIPTDVPARKIGHDIAEQLEAYVGEALFPAEERHIYSERLNRTLAPEETFCAAGIWNGDYLTIS